MLNKFTTTNFETFLGLEYRDWGTILEWPESDLVGCPVSILPLDISKNFVNSPFDIYFIFKILKGTVSRKITGVKSGINR